MTHSFTQHMPLCPTSREPLNVRLSNAQRAGEHLIRTLVSEAPAGLVSVPLGSNNLVFQQCLKETPNRT